MAARNATRQTIGTLLFLLWGPLCWALQLTLTYGSQSSLCAFDLGERANGHNPLASLVALTIITLAMIVAALPIMVPSRLFSGLAAAPAPPAQQAFLTGIARALAVLSLAAMAFTALAVVILPACAQLR